MRQNNGESPNYICGCGEEKRLTRNNSDTESIGVNFKNLVNSDISEREGWKRGWESHIFQELECKVTGMTGAPMGNEK